MSTERTAAPWHLWLVGILALLWNAGGAFDYTMTQTRNLDYLSIAAENAGVPVDTIIDYFTNFPIWADAAWAFGVWGAVTGAILLLLRSRFSFYAFAVSLVGIAGTTLHTARSGMPAELQTSFNLAFSLAIIFVTVLLAWYARWMTKRGVLR